MIINLLILTLTFLPTFAADASSTVVALNDPELMDFLIYLFSQLGGSTLIPITLLETLGLNTASIISTLQSMGFTILW